MAAKPWLLGIFQVDVSCPVGHALCGGLVRPADSIRDPVHARGLVLDDGSKRVVLCAVEYTALTDHTFERWQKAIARGAGCRPDHVLLHCVHQHDSLYLSILQDEAMRAVGRGILARSLVPEYFLATAAYGEGSLMYAPTAADYAMGGYEPTFSFTTPAVEPSLKLAIAELLDSGGP